MEKDLNYFGTPQDINIGNKHIVTFDGFTILAEESKLSSDPQLLRSFAVNSPSMHSMHRRLCWPCFVFPSGLTAIIFLGGALSSVRQTCSNHRVCCFLFFVHLVYIVRDCSLFFTHCSIHHCSIHLGPINQHRYYERRTNSDSKSDVYAKLPSYGKSSTASISLAPIRSIDCIYRTGHMTGSYLHWVNWFLDRS